jgi:hypothetical protein
LLTQPILENLRSTEDTYIQLMFLRSVLLAGLADPCKSDLVKTIREGSIRSVGCRVVKKKPITPEILRQLVNVYARF